MKGKMKGREKNGGEDEGEDGEKTRLLNNKGKLLE